MTADPKALVAVLVLTVATILALRWLLKGSFLYDILERRRNVWLAATVIAFAVPNFVLAMILLGALYVWAARRDPYPVGIFLMFLLAVPPWEKDLEGFGPFAQLFTLNNFRTMSLAILLPLAVKLLVADRKPASSPPATVGRITDASVVVMFFYMLVIYFPEESATALMRRALLMLLDFVLPYFVISRCLRDRAAVMDSLGSLLLAGLIVAPIAVFEHFKGWLLYESTAGGWGIVLMIPAWLARDDRLRALASSGHSLVLGHYFVVCFALVGIFSAQIKSNWKPLALWGALLLGLYATLSRGPLVASAAVMLMMGIFTGRAMRYYAALAAACVLITVGLAFSPWWDKVVRILPFIGTVDEFNVTYRQQLFDATLLMVSQRPWFGTIHVLDYLEHLRQGQGIIDLVNTYAIYAMRYGLVGLSLFLMILGSGVVFGMQVAFKHRRDDPELYRIAGCTTAALIGSMIAIVAVSNINSIPIIYISLVAVLVAMARMTAPVPRRRTVYGHSMQRAQADAAQAPRGAIGSR